MLNIEVIEDSASYVARRATLHAFAGVSIGLVPGR